MNSFDDEKKIIEYLQNEEVESICFPVENEEVIKVFESIYLYGGWQKWNDSSGKSDPPPDFYCDELKLMMDIMRVDDHAFISEKGKLANPMNARESMIQKKLKDLGIKDRFPNADIIVNAITDLPTDQDHNYTFYKENFIRTIDKHNKKIELYRKNHPEFKTIFLIMDESSFYVESKKTIKAKKRGQIVEGVPHCPFADKAFIDTILSSQIDYIIWISPYKYIEVISGLANFPSVYVIDVKNYNIELNTYKEELMVSLED